MEGDELCYTYLYLQVEGRGEGGIYWPQLPRQGYSLCLDSLQRVSQLKGFWPLGSRSTFIRGFMKDDILACVET